MLGSKIKISAIFYGLLLEAKKVTLKYKKLEKVWRFYIKWSYIKVRFNLSDDTRTLLRLKNSVAILLLSTKRHEYGG